jgi:DNA-nicking Smr family endonuclease
MDLHGASLASAHEAALAHVDQSKFHHKHVMIITGKSGPMSSHMPRWLDHLPHVKQVDTLPGGGAFRVWLRKPKK